MAGLNPANMQWKETTEGTDLGKMGNKLPISAYKEKAKEQLLGHYKVAALSILLLFAIIYGIILLTMFATMSYSVGGSMNDIARAAQAAAQQQESVDLGDDVKITNSTDILMNSGIGTSLDLKSYAINEVIAIVMSLLTNLFTTGFIYVCSKISYGREVAVRDMFYVFKHNPDKVLILTFLTTLISLVFTLPAQIIQFVLPSTESGKNFLIWAVCYAVGMIASVVFDMMFAMVYLIYLDDIEVPVLDCMKQSAKMMRGNKWRLFYMQLSFVGYACLALLSCGIGLLWMMPYVNVSIVNFYRDLKGDFTERVMFVAPEDAVITEKSQDTAVSAENEKSQTPESDQDSDLEQNSNEDISED